MKFILTAISLLSLSLTVTADVAEVAEVADIADVAEAPRYYLSISGVNGRQFFPGSAIAPGAPDNAATISNFTFNAFIQERGGAQRSPFIIYRSVDASSPILLTNLISNTALPEVRIVAVLRSNGTAAGTVGYFYSLSNARISGIDTIAGKDSIDEKISITFESLQTYFFDGIQSTLANWGGKGKALNPLNLFGNRNTKREERSNSVQRLV